ALPCRPLAAAQEVDEAHKEGQVNREKVVAEKPEADALHTLAKEEPHGCPEVKGKLAQERDPVQRPSPHESAAHQHGNEREGQDPAQYLVRKESEGGHRVE